MLRRFLRCDVLIPFLFTEESDSLGKIESKWRATRADPKLASFVLREYGESFFVEDWAGQ